MIYENEKQLLRLIRYIPILVLAIITITILIFLYFENLNNFAKHKEELHSNYIIKSKALIKERIDNTYDYIKHKQQNTEEELIKTLRDETNKVHSIIYSIYERYKDTKTEEEIKDIVRSAIKPIRFNNGRGYFFINDKKTHKNLLHATMPHLENISLYNLTDARGVFIARQMYKVLKHQDEAVLQWYWYKPGDKKKQYKKIGFVKNFKPYDWFIGTGEYVKDFEKQMQEQVLERIQNTHFDNNGYIFILNYDGTVLSHYNKDSLYKNALLIPRVKEAIRKLLDTAKKNPDGDYVSYSHVKHPRSLKPSDKTSYVKALTNWQWVIGTGFYKDDVNKSIAMKKDEYDKTIVTHMKNTIIISIILAFTILILSLYLSKIVNKKIIEYKKAIKKYLSKEVEQHKLLSQQTKMAAMGEMIGNIAHQWRQPLSSITSSATAMIVEKKMDILDDNSLIDGLENISNKAKFLSKTIDDFRNFYNNDERKSEFSLESCIGETLSLIDSQLKQNNISIITNVEDIRVYNNKNKFIQVLINIINNAKDVLLESADEKFIFIESKVKKDKLILSVTDTAGGISEEIIDKIFEPYFTTKHQSQGTGIGLYMSNEIITQHMDGLLKVENKEFKHNHKSYKGASFKIIVPIKKVD